MLATKVSLLSALVLLSLFGLLMIDLIQEASTRSGFVGAARANGPSRLDLPTLVLLVGGLCACAILVYLVCAEVVAVLCMLVGAVEEGDRLIRGSMAFAMFWLPIDIAVTWFTYFSVVFLRRTRVGLVFMRESTLSADKESLD